MFFDDDDVTTALSGHKPDVVAAYRKRFLPRQSTRPPPNCPARTCRRLSGCCEARDGGAVDVGRGADGVDGGGHRHGVGRAGAVVGGGGVVGGAGGVQVGVLVGKVEQQHADVLVSAVVGGLVSPNAVSIVADRRGQELTTTYSG